MPTLVGPRAGHKTRAEAQAAQGQSVNYSRGPQTLDHGPLPVRGLLGTSLVGGGRASETSPVSAVALQRHLSSSGVRLS